MSDESGLPGLTLEFVRTVTDYEQHRVSLHAQAETAEEAKRCMTFLLGVLERVKRGDKGVRAEKSE